MTEPIFKPRLPSFGAQDGDQIITSSGNVYEFNIEKNEWVCIGIIPNPDVVSSSSDGLVTPDVYRKLTLIQELIERGFDFSMFKLNTDVDQDPYFYYFHSSDDLVKFSPERCVEPKEVLARPIVAQVVDREDGTTSILFTDAFNLDFDGLTLETEFGNFKIVSSTNNSIIITGSSVNILPGDFVKIVKEESVVSKLRIEVDRGRLYQKLVRNCCVGPKGNKGDKGDTGTAGVAADDEVFQTPIITTDGRFTWSAIVETPIDTPISLRVFGQDDNNPILEILHPIDGTSPMVIINDDDLNIEETSFESNYESTSKLFSGSFTVLSGGEDIDAWRFKARQRGPKGAAGEDGKAFLEVITQLLDDPSVRSTDAVLSMRKAAASDDLVIFRSALFEEIPVSNLSAMAGRIDNILEDNFASVAVTIEEAKDIGFFKFDEPDFAAPQLDIPLWTPTADCVQARRWSQYRFNWFDQTDPDYLFSILGAPRPPEQCCQEDFFFCPNVGDNPCGIQGEVEAPLPLPVDCFCDCINPIADELAGGGLTFNPIDLLDSENSAENQMFLTEEDRNINVIGSGDRDDLLSLDNVKANALSTAESIIDGTENNFVQDIKMVGNGEIIVILEYDSDPCGGLAEERESCAFVDSNAVQSSFMLTDRSGTAVVSSNMLEASTIPTTVAFTVQGQSRVIPSDVVTEAVKSKDCPFSIGSELSLGGEPGQEVIVEDSVEFDIADLQLKVAVNTTGVNYCRGYRITIIASSDQTEEFVLGDITTRIPDGDPETVLDITQTGGGFPITSGSDGALPTDDDDDDFVTPVSSYADEGAVVSGGLLNPETAIETVINNSSFVIEFDISQLIISVTGDENIFVDFSDLDLGVLQKSPTSFHVFDAFQDNNLLGLGRVTLSKTDAGFDEGPWGTGTYGLAGDNTVRLFSRIPNVLVREDTLEDAVYFFNEPQGPGEEFEFFFVSKITGGTIFDNADSIFVEKLIDSGLTDGIIVVRGGLSGDPMEAAAGGSILFVEQGSVVLGYQQESDLNAIYPEVLIEPSGGPEPEPPAPAPDPGLNNIVTTPTSFVAGQNSVEYDFGYDANSSLPSDGQIWITFPSGFDVSGVTTATSSAYDGGFNVAVDGQVVKVTRDSSGADAASGAYDISVSPVINVETADLYDWTISTRDSDDVIIDGPDTGGEIEILAGPVSDVNSTVDATPTSGLVADGIESSLVVVNLYDDFLNPIEGELITLSSTGSNNTFDPASGTTNSSGQFISDFTTTTGEAKTVSADNTPGIGVLSDTAMVTFDPAAGPGSGISDFNVEVSNAVEYELEPDYTFTFTTSSVLPADGKIVVTLPSDVWAGSLDPGTISSGTIDGTFDITLDGSDVIFARNGDGTPTTAGILDLTAGEGISNGGAGFFDFNVKTTDSGDSVIDGPESTDSPVEFTSSGDRLELTGVKTIGDGSDPFGEFLDVGIQEGDQILYAYAEVLSDVVMSGSGSFTMAMRVQNRLMVGTFGSWMNKSIMGDTFSAGLVSLEDEWDTSKASLPLDTTGATDVQVLFTFSGPGSPMTPTGDIRATVIVER